MAGRLMVCRACDRYTLRQNCPVCGKAAITPHPVRYSPEDPYGSYRRKLKMLEREKAGTVTKGK